MKFQTYLAGAFCRYKNHGKRFDDWRDFVTEKVNNKKIRFYDPRANSRQICPAVFTIDDAKGVLNSDILLHYRTPGFEDEGASWEQGIAFACNLLKGKHKKKLIIYADETKVPFPLHFASANVNFSSLETAVEFLNCINSVEKKDFMKIWMRLLDKERI